MAWLLGIFFELILFNTPLTWKVRRAASVLVFLVVFISSIIHLPTTAIHFVLAALLIAFRLLNILRVTKGRMHPDYMRHATRRTSWVLVSLYAAVLMADSSFYGLGSVLPIFTLLTSIIILTLAMYHIRKTQHATNTNHYSDKELPTVSVCIPARNETEALEQSLRSVIANDYPKLEILVLDDCSQDKTAEIIKSFAQDGVRFIQGHPPEERWLAKNHAYDKLLESATGELVLFCGVDVQFGPHAIRALVTTLLNRKKSMISVMPLRFYSKLNEAFVQPMRYWWELVPPRKLFKRPAVLSTCWLVDRKKMQKAGGFDAVSHAVIPEGYFARYFARQDEYGFIRADEELDIRTTKPFSEQWATAIRTNYPQIRRRPEMALLLTVFTLIVLVWPFVELLRGLITLNPITILISGLTCLFLTLTHVAILKVSDPANVSIGLFTLPISAVTEVVIGYTSMLKYEFGSVDWKDRNICIPVMHVVPKLPNMDTPITSAAIKNQ